MPIHYDVRDHIATIVIDRPEARNALDPEHFALMADTWRRFRDEDDAWVAVITGKDDAFCAGADLKSQSNSQADGQPTRSPEEVGKDVFVSLLRDFDLFKPIIAAVNGVCAGGGMEMLGGIDIRVASTTARFGVPEPRRGLMAAGGTTSRLPRQIPFPFAMEFLLTGKLFDADQAFAMGLLNKVVPPDQLMDAAMEYATTIAANAPIAVRATKQSAIQGWSTTLKEAYVNEMALIGPLLQTEDSKEGPRAFAEKRPPVWKGR
jgi:enoyl-CoA hydratase